MWKPTSPMRRFCAAAMVAGAVFCASADQAHSLTCVQFVQRASPVTLHGDAWRWWEGARGQYQRGRHPVPGAVMVFARTRALPLGHVAMVKAVRDSRTILVDHANWSPIHGRRGHIERGAMIVDVSPANDWSRVRVWYQPARDLGGGVYAVRGFVYPGPASSHAS